MSELDDRTNWHARNRDYLMSQVTQVRGWVARSISTDFELVVDAEPQQATGDAAEPWPLDTLCLAFQLSQFERSLLLLCAGVELDASVARLCGEAQGDANRSYPTFSLALAALPDPNWFAITPDAPLRRWRLIDVLDSREYALTQSPLRIDERILHFLTGIQHLDSRLAGIVAPLPVVGRLVESHAQLAAQIAARWSQPGQSPLVQLAGPDTASKHVVAAAVAEAQGLTACLLTADVIPASAVEQETLHRLWEREAVLGGHMLVIDCDDLDHTDSNRTASVTRFLTRASGLVLLTSRERWQLAQRQTAAFDVAKPTGAEQNDLWREAAAEELADDSTFADELVAQFDLNARDIEAAVSDARQQLGTLSEPTEPRDDDDERPEHPLWRASRLLARPRMDDLAQRIEPNSTWRDLILPEEQTDTLKTIPLHVRHRTQVYDDWGFGGTGGRGLGITALFAGASGTGKTLAAEVLARSLRLDLYRVDLSQVVSKYIGETEKNLFRLFDAAEAGGAVLLFDEADALFGKRSEVKDSHDRYANIEVSYLLQRMEAYRGLAILTTNLKSALDPAFMRRIRFIIQFPFPDVAQRARIWKRMFPNPDVTRGIDVDKLAQLDLAGGNIRNIALNAAFLAAGHAELLGMEHLLSAARAEYAKLEKPLTDQEVRGWIREQTLSPA